MLDYIAAIAIFAVAPAYHWLGPTVQAKLFIFLVFLCAVWVFVLTRLDANPLAEGVGSKERTSLAGVVGIVLLLATLLPFAVDAKKELTPHNPPSLPSKLMGIDQTTGGAMARYLEPLSAIAGGTGFYGSNSSPYFFSATTWLVRYPQGDENRRLGAQMFEGVHDVNIGEYTCANYWTGRIGSYEYENLRGLYNFTALFLGRDLRKEQVYDGDPLTRVFEDTSQQAKYFLHVGSPPANEQVPPPQSIGCGDYRDSIYMLVVFFRTQDGGVPPPLVVSQIFDELYSYYRA